MIGSAPRWSSYPFAIIAVGIVLSRLLGKPQHRIQLERIGGLLPRIAADFQLGLGELAKAKAQRLVNEQFLRETVAQIEQARLEVDAPKRPAITRGLVDQNLNGVDHHFTD
jgi:hypothetical protein